MLQGDPARLRQLVMILVDNAVRHSPRGGAVRVDGASRRARRASIEVADEGPGRARRRTCRTCSTASGARPGAPSGGTGLGLAIAQLDRRPPRRPDRRREPREGGALFRVELPAIHPPPAGPAVAPAGPERPRRRLVA